MKADKVRRMAAAVLRSGSDRIWFDPQQLEKIESVMTKDDVRGLIGEGVIKKRKPRQQSKGRARKLREKKRKGRKRGFGKRKGTKKARGEGKKKWVKSVRSQRRTLRELKKKKPKEVEKAGYRKLYKRIKGNLFKGKKYVQAAVEGKKG